MNFILGCLIFIVIAVTIPAQDHLITMDPDTTWHLMAGNLIRSTGHVPLHDPGWAFTAGDQPWYDISWLWDVWMSVLQSHYGWYGQLAFNGICIGLTTVFIYQACALRTRHGLASLTVAAIAFFSSAMTLRPLWATNVFLSGFFYLALLVRYKKWSVKWWYLLPLVVLAWVNIHGGFIMVFLLLGAVGLQALKERNFHHFIHLCMGGLLSLGACFATPYGIHIVDAIWATIGSPSREFINEWQPLTTSWDSMSESIFLPLFIAGAICYETRTSFFEGLLAFGFLFLAFTGIRYLAFFYIFAAPLLADYCMRTLHYVSSYRPVANFQQHVKRITLPLFQTHMRAKKIACLSSVMLVVIALYLPMTPKIYHYVDYSPYKQLQPTINFMKKRYAHAHVLNDYDLGGPLILESNGTFPVFIDGRAETAYPRNIITSYSQFLKSDGDWEDMIDDYDIEAIVLPADNDTMVDRFEERQGWTEVYSDDEVIIVEKEKPRPKS